MLLRFAAVMAAAVSLTACETVSGDRTAVVSASASSVSIRFDEGHLPAATERANELCSNYGRRAQLDRVTPMRGEERLAAFNCI